MMNQYNIVIPISIKDMKILEKNLFYIKKNLDFRKIVIIGNDDVEKEIIKLNDSDLLFISEDSLIPNLSYKTIANILEKRCGKKRRAGWYLQQFLKLGYSKICEDNYYLVWDSDTIPLKKINFLTDNKVLVNLKREYNKPYFDTMNKLFDMDNTKIIDGSFISEHMLFSKQIVLELIDKIECNEKLYGNSFFEKIMYSINKKDLNKSGFSEYETYGTYCMLYYSDFLTIRNLNTLRHGKRFLGDNPSNDILEWVSVNYDTVSFEKFDHSSKKYIKETNLYYKKNKDFIKLINRKKRRIKFEDGVISLIRKILR